MSKQPTYRYVYTVHERSEYSEAGDDTSYSFIFKMDGFDISKARYKAQAILEKGCTYATNKKRTLELREVEEL